MTPKLTTPVIFLFWKRPETTVRVLEKIREAKPRELFLVADGPRDEREKILCAKTRELVKKMIDWDCQIYKNYSDINLGCRARVSSGIDWAFRQTDRAIILEDDCLPYPDFFYFCEELLKKYKNYKHIMHIGGTNTQQNNNEFNCEESYYFSQIAQIWGWATWKRAWQRYDVNIKNWPQVKESERWKMTLPNYAVREYWTNLMEEMYQNKNPRKNTWDAQWFYAVLTNNGLAITPKNNLITNIGFGVESTHALQNDAKANLPLNKLELPIVHPTAIKINIKADNYNWKFVFRINNTWKKKIKSFLRHYVPELYSLAKEFKNRYN